MTNLDKHNSGSNPSRRDFIRQTTLLAGSALVGFNSFTAKPKFKMGLQLFTIRDPLSKDAKGTLKKVASLGYENLETYGFDPVRINYYGYSAKDFRALLEDLGLTTTTGHYDFASLLSKPEDDLKRYVDKCIEGADALKQKYITWPWLDPDSRTLDKFKLVAEKLNKMGEQTKNANLTIAYHNHNFEFIEHNGKIGYDIIVNETDPALVKLQIDLYWATHSPKLTPHEWFIKQPGRFVMWHVKDMDKKTRDLY